MKLPCKLVEDILPLYHDGVCSDETRKLVKNHVDECFECRMLLKKLDGEIAVPPRVIDDAKPLRRIRHEWLRTRKRALIKGAAMAVVAAALIISAWWALTDLKLVPVPTEKIAINDLSVTSDGAIAFQLLIDDGRELRYVQTDIDSASGTVYLTPRRAVIEPRREGNRYMSLNGEYFFVRMEAMSGEKPGPAMERFLSLVADADITRLCLGTEKDCVVLWEEGKTLPTATEQVEALYKAPEKTE